jgi:hypothetical protein
MISGRSLQKKEKKMGPRTDPWGTPYLTLLRLYFVSLTIVEIDLSSR